MRSGARRPSETEGDEVGSHEGGFYRNTWAMVRSLPHLVDINR
jgi:hypothetical protein